LAPSGDGYDWTSLGLVIGLSLWGSRRRAHLSPKSDGSSR
jgi:hypothetical protein